MGEPARVPDRDERQKESSRGRRGKTHQDAQWWETGGDDWWRSDRADAVGWGLAFIWGGLILLASNMGIGDRYAWWDAWSVFFVGAGLISIGVAGARAAATRQREKSLGGLIFGLILLGIGLGEFVVWLWPAVLLVIGLLILRSVISRNRGSR